MHCAALIRLCVVLYSAKSLSATVVDSTLDETAIGADVVQACVTKIEDANIFTEDYNFLRYLAYAETEDGGTIILGDTGGIWKVESSTFSSIADETYDVTSYYSAIESAFGIQWASVVYNDLKKPLYSALGYRLHLAHLENTKNQAIPSDTALQGLWWSVEIHPDEDSLNSAVYVARISGLLTGCLQPSRDVVFLVDSSVASGDDHFMLAKSIVENVIKRLKVDSNQNLTTVGIAQYSDGLQVVTYLDGSAVESNLTDFLNSMELMSGLRFTGAATELTLKNFFKVSNGAKGLGSGSPRVLVVVTAGDSHDNLESISSAANQAGVSIIAVATTETTSESELNDTASDPDEDHVFQLTSTYTQTMLEFAVAEQICDDGLVTPLGVEIGGIIAPGQSRFLKAELNTTDTDIVIRTSQGTLTFYYSTTIPSPSSALHDFSLPVTQPNQNVSVEFVPGSQDALPINLYITLECTSDVDVHFVLTILDDTAVTSPSVNITLNVTISTNATSSGSSGELSAGEIAGIVFSGLIVFCAILIAIVYYRFGKTSDEKKPLMHKGELNRFADSSSGGFSETTLSTGVSKSRLISEPDSGKVIIVDQLQEDAHDESPDEAIQTNAADDKELDPIAQEKRSAIGVRERLHSAIQRRDISDLQVAVEDFRYFKLEDITGDYMKAQRMIAVQQCKEGLTRAINLRNIKLLQKAILHGKKMEYDADLRAKTVDAEILLQELKKIDSLLKRMKQAMDAGDLEIVEVVTAELRVIKGCDQATVDRLLLMFRYREELELAMHYRALEELKLAMAKVTEKGFQQNLLTEMNEAKRMLRELEMVERVRNDVTGLQQSKVSEIRSYGNPPPGVHEVMMAVYLMLDYDPMQLQSWTAIQALMGRTGRDSLRRMVAELTVSDVDVASARMAKSLLEHFDLRSIRDISEGLAVFYLFAKTVISEVERLLPDSTSTEESPQMMHYVTPAPSYKVDMGLAPVIVR